jgi:integrase
MEPEKRKRGKSGDGSLSLRSEPGVTPQVWTLRLDLMPDLDTGKRRQVAGTFKGNEREAAVALADFVKLQRLKLHGNDPSELRDGSTLVKSTRPSASGTIGDLTWDDLFEKWIISPGKNLKRKADTTQYQERKRYERHVRPSFGKRLVSSSGHIEIQEFYDRLLSVSQRQDSEDEFVLSHTSVTRVHQLMRAMCKFGVRRDLILHNPYERISFSVRKLPVPVAPELAAVGQLLSWLSSNDPLLYFAARLAAECGLRRSEIIGLRWGAVGQDGLTGLKSVAVSSGVVVVPGRKKNEARYVTTETKTGRRGSGVLGIDDEFAKQIDKMWYQGMEEWFASPNKSPDHKFGDGYIFSDDFGETCWHPDTLTARLKRGRERALEQHPYGAILEITFKSLRAYTATRLQGLGFSAITATAVLRHEHNATAEKYYIAGNAAQERLATVAVGEELNRYFDE